MKNIKETSRQGWAGGGKGADRKIGEQARLAFADVSRIYF
jgi:hypothetical protein